MTKKYFQELVTVALPDSKSGPRTSRFRSTNEVITLAWNNPATRIAYSRTDGSIRVWKLQKSTCELASKIPVIIDDCHQKQVESISWRPTTESTLASVGNDQNVKIWNATKGSLVKTIDTGIGGNIVVQYSGDGKYITALSKLNVVTVIDADSYEILDTLKFDVDIYSVAWNNTSAFLFFGLANGTISLYSFKDTKLKHIHDLQGHRSSIKTIEVEPRGRYLVAGSNEGVISIWSLETLAVVKVFCDIDQSIAQIDVSRDGCYVTATYEDGETAKIYEIESRECSHTLPKCVAGSQTFPNLVFCPIKNLFAYSTDDGDVLLTNKRDQRDSREQRTYRN